MLTHFLPALFAVLIVAVPAPVDPVKAELERLQGTWTVVAIKERGKDVELPKEFGFKIVFSEKELYYIKNGKESKRTPFKLDLSKTPKHIDTPIDDAEKDDPWVPGIYEINGDDLKLSIPGYRVEVKMDAEKTRKVEVGKRPSSFDDKDGGVLILKRTKK